MNKEIKIYTPLEKALICFDYYNPIKVDENKLLIDGSIGYNTIKRFQEWSCTNIVISSYNNNKIQITFNV